jgi:hypothetical protein
MITPSRHPAHVAAMRGAGLLALAAVMLLRAGFTVAAGDPPALPRVLPCASTPSTVLFVFPDGSARVNAWDNKSGQLGDGTQDVPPAGDGSLAGYPVPGVTDAVGAAAGENYILLLRRDGTVLGWGANGNGQLGLGAKGTVPEFGKIPKPVLRPTQVPDLAGVRQLAVGAAASFAVMADGTVRATGANHEGLLGLGDAMPPALARIGRAHYFHRDSRAARRQGRCGRVQGLRGGAPRGWHAEGLGQQPSRSARYRRQLAQSRADSRSWG